MSAFNKLKIFGRHRDEANAAAVEAVSANITDILAVATNEANVNQVATNIQVIIDNSADISTAATNIADIIATVANQTNINTVATNIPAINNAAAVLALFMSYDATKFRLDDDSNNQGEILVVNHQTVHQIIDGKKFYFGDGYIPFVANTNYDLDLVCQMQSAEVGKNVGLQIDVYNKSGQLLRTTQLEPTVPDDVSEFTINFTSIIQNTDVSTDTHGTIMVSRSAPVSNPHTAGLQVKIARLNDA